MPGFICGFALAATVDPFDVVQLSFPGLMVFWLLVMILAALSAGAAQRIVSRILPSQHRMLHDLSIALGIFVLFTPFLWLLVAIVVWSARGNVFPGLTEIGSYGVIAASGMILLKAAVPSAAAEKPQDSPRLKRRLADDFRGEILRLTVEDHSVRVVTTEGTHVIRMRFSDAIDEMEPVRGYCTHRSHWVSEKAIESVERQSGRVSLRLCNGDLVPVSRKYRPELERLGVI
ncbi:LytTR family DNA-binding domain-containing protein [Lutimaribacter marinistellae]|uniref:LytTR family DNA-binding domain-containing protein n=1 Tax=Lutimaribacter marinistellae TaxID=1820329 RepID=A0ABV7TF14_9RHOB